jgi:protein TonB
VSLSGSSATPNVQKSAPTQPNASNEVVASADRGNPEAVAAPAVKETPPQVVLGTPEDSPPPVYPQIAKIARVQGQVILLATVDKSGLVRDVSVVSGHPMLTAAATKAVSQWRYKPYLLNGKPVDAETRVTINFKLPQ